MINYDSGTWAVGFVFQAYGSVLPKSLVWAVPAGVLAAGLKYYSANYLPDLEFDNILGITAAYSVVLSFLLVYRAQIAYGRFWDGASHFQTIRSVWFNACSNCVAFSSEAPQKAVEVQRFQHQLVRLMSMAYASALQVVSGKEIDYEILNPEGIEKIPMHWMTTQHDKLEVIMQWIQHLVVNEHRDGVIDIAPPILSRVFQEFSNGMVDVANAKRIVKFPFPFPYAQMISLMLIAHVCVTVVVAGLAMGNAAFAFIYAFASVLGVWSINYIAIEIENPFGTDPNDLPLRSMQKSMNDSLVILLHPNVQHIPTMSKIGQEHLKISSVKWELPESVRLQSEGKKGEIYYDVGNCVAERAPAEPKPTPQLKPAEPSLIASMLERQFDTLAMQMKGHCDTLTAELRNLSKYQAELNKTLTSTDALRYAPGTIGRQTYEENVTQTATYRIDSSNGVPLLQDRGLGGRLPNLCLPSWGDKERIQK